MRPALLAAALLTASCSAPVRRVGGLAFPEPPEVKDPNFILVVSETVPDAGGDSACFTKVFVDGREAGQTGLGRRSETRTLRLKLPSGNRPVRIEQWFLPAVGEWTRLSEGQQPRERFVRIEDGSIARLELRFTEGEASNTLTLSRQPARP